MQSAKQIAHAPQPTVWSADKERELVPVASVRGKKRCRVHGGAHGSGAPSGLRNGNDRHGRRTAEAVADRRELMAFIREARKLAKQAQADVE